MAESLLTPELIPRLAEALGRHNSVANAARELGLDRDTVHKWLCGGATYKRGRMRELYDQALAAGYRPRRRRRRPMQPVCPVSPTKPRPPEPWEADRLMAVLQIVTWARRAKPGATTWETLCGVLAAINRGEINLGEWARRGA